MWLCFNVMLMALTFAEHVTFFSIIFTFVTVCILQQFITKLNTIFIFLLFPFSHRSRGLHLQGQAVVGRSLVFAAVVLAIVDVDMIQLQEAHEISGRLQETLDKTTCTQGTKFGSSCVLNDVLTSTRTGTVWFHTVQ